MTREELKELCENFDSEDVSQFQKIMSGFSEFDEFDEFVDGLTERFGVNPSSPKIWAEGKNKPYSLFRGVVIGRIFDWLNKITGELDFETGLEGIRWDIFDENKEEENYGMTLIEPGDYLKVFGEDDSVVFDGEIVADYKTGWMEYPLSPGEGVGQQCALGFWVHWIQEGWQPDDWDRLFIKEDEHKLRAELTKK